MAAYCRSSGFIIDTELLISAVQEQKCIWDSSSEDYKNRDKKQNAFTRIAEMLVAEFNDLSEARKQEAINIITRRWKTARDAYVRDKAKLTKLPSGTARKKYKTYVFFENLKFLDKIVDLNETETNYDMEGMDLTEKNNDDDESEDNADNEDAEPSMPTRQNIEKTFQKQKRKQNNDLDQQLLSFLADAKKDDQDEDKAFFTSLLPTLKSFDDFQKLQFRSEVLKIMMEIKQVPSYRPNRTLVPIPSPSPSGSAYSYGSQTVGVSTGHSGDEYRFNYLNREPSLTEYSGYTPPPPLPTQPTLTELTNTRIEDQY